MLGLLLISDATHVMTAIGFVGINVAIQDAIATAKLPTDPMKQERIHAHELAEVQSQRQDAVSSIQTIQSLIQNRNIQ